MDNNSPQKDEENIGSFYMGRMRPPPEPKRLLPPGVLTVIAVIALGGIVWYAYPRGAERYTNVDVPVVKADTAPIKEAPADPGGMEVRHQDSTVFSAMEKGSGTEVENILPSPEEPVNKDEAIKTSDAASPIPSAQPPKLDLQMKDEGNGTEKIIPPPAAQPPAQAAAPSAKAVDKKVTEKEAAKPSAKVETKPKADVKTAVKAETGKPSAAVAGVGYEVQLGAYRDMDGLKKDWERLKKKFPAQLSSLKMRAVKADVPGKGLYYRLQAGTLEKEKARAVCDALKGKVGCILVK